MYRSLSTLIASLLIVSLAHAENDNENKPRGEHRGPPEVALEACSSSVQGDSCSFEGRHGEVLNGTCEAPEDKPLACRPDGGPRDNLQEIH